MVKVGSSDEKILMFLVYYIVFSIFDVGGRCENRKKEIENKIYFKFGIWIKKRLVDDFIVLN